MSKNPKERLESRLIRELKKQIHRLKKENGQLRKINSKLDNDFVDEQMELEMDGISEVAVASSKKHKEKNIEVKHRCPKCGAYETITFLLREVMYYKCMSCDTKGKLK